LAILLARHLGPRDWGLFSAFLGFSLGLSIFIEFGLTQWLLRELAGPWARHHSTEKVPLPGRRRAGRIVGASVAVNAVFGATIIVGAGVAAAAFRIGPSSAVLLLALVTYGALLASCSALEAVFREPLTSGPDTKMAPVLAAALTQIPKKLHYTYGRTIFGDLVSRPIPRVPWSDKPKIPRDKLIATLWPIESKKGGINPEFSVLLYFFWDFGIPGVVAGMLLFGLGARALFEYFRSYRKSAAVQVLYTLALWFIVIGLRNSPVDTLVQAVFVVLPAWIAFRVSTWRGVRFAAVVSR
jgi:hypothetical protein